jgi:hypothetical protein
VIALLGEGALWFEVCPTPVLGSRTGFGWRGGVFLMSEILGMRVFSATKDSGGGWIFGLGEFEVGCFPT